MDGHALPGIPALHDHLMNSTEGYNPMQYSGSEKQYKNFGGLPLYCF